MVAYKIPNAGKIITAINIVLVFIALIFCMNFQACSKDTIDAPDNSITDPNATDYSKSEHWLSLPATVNKSVDVFYLYPTAWQKRAGDSNICEINNPSMLKGSDLAFKRQATAFDTIANIYAPYYRQVDIAYRMSLSLEDGEKVVAGIPTKDAIAAFDYYVKHYNSGRPYILAGHSQGANVLNYLLSIYMKENPQVYARMIAAYVIGYSVTNTYLAKNPHLKFAQGPDDTGVIISYNTESPDVIPGTNVVLTPGGIAINPITWTRDETLATADKNLGSIILNSDGTVAAGIPTPVMNFADARVDKAKGVVICSTVDVNKWSPGNSVFVRGVFHSFDYPFYYYNIRANAANRVAKYYGR
jgi:hypothetical protein